MKIEDRARHQVAVMIAEGISSVLEDLEVLKVEEAMPDQEAVIDANQIMMIVEDTSKVFES